MKSFAAVAILAAALPQLASAVCSKFTPAATNAYNYTTGKPLIISRGITCNGGMGGDPISSANGSTWTPAGLSASTDQLTRLYNTMKENPNVTVPSYGFNVYVPGMVANTSVCVANGANGYMAFYPTLYCVAGKFFGCDASSSKNDIVGNNKTVLMCAPTVVNGQPNGTIRFVSTNTSVAKGRHLQPGRHRRRRCPRRQGLQLRRRCRRRRCRCLRTCVNVASVRAGGFGVFLLCFRSFQRFPRARVVEEKAPSRLVRMDEPVRSARDPFLWRRVRVSIT
ncbi:hypothetical protein MRB53_041346 [Persea americana]|nr:hypothetical protein MRB53_041346 [Persea americana]